MNKKFVVGLGILAALAMIAGAAWTRHGRTSESSQPRGPATAEQIQPGEGLFARNCAPCHGQKAAGQIPAEPNGGIDDNGKYTAPALDGTAHAWHHSDAVLFSWIKQGSVARDSPMRGWEGRMTDEQIWSVIRYFQSLWPEKMRLIQRQRSMGQQ
jgi:mono/diheme cytochrome c family protein